MNKYIIYIRARLVFLKVIYSLFNGGQPESETIHSTQHNRQIAAQQIIINTKQEL